MGTHTVSAPMSAAVASARACLDVFRGAAVLIEHNREALVQLLTAGWGDGTASGDQELAMLHGLGRHISEVIELCTSTGKVRCGALATAGILLGQEEMLTVESKEQQSHVKQSCPVPPTIDGRIDLPTSQPGNRRPALSSQFSEGVAGVVETLEVEDVHIKRHRGQDMQDERQRPHHHHSAAATTFRQFSNCDSATVTVMSTPELLLHIMGYLSGGSADVCKRREELCRMALVCRAWRDAAHSETLWRPLALELIPRLADEDSHVTQEELQVNASGSYRQYLVQCGQLAGKSQMLDVNIWADELILQCEVWDEDGSCMFSTECELEVDEVEDRLFMCAYDEGPLLSVSSPCARYDGTPTASNFVGAGFHVRMTGHHKKMGRKMLLYNDHMSVGEVIPDDGHFYLLSDQCRFSSTLYGPDSIDGRVGFTLEPTDDVNGDGDDHTPWRVTCAFMRFDTTDDLSVGRLIWSVSH